MIEHNARPLAVNAGHIGCAGRDAGEEIVEQNDVERHCEHRARGLLAGVGMQLRRDREHLERRATARVIEDAGDEPDER